MKLQKDIKWFTGHKKDTYSGEGKEIKTHIMEVFGEKKWNMLNPAQKRKVWDVGMKIAKKQRNYRKNYLLR